MEGVDPSSVIVMDDRTSEIYLNELRDRHPGIRIADLSETKRRTKRGIEEPTYISGWRATIEREAGEFLMLLEDDCWIAGAVSLEAITDSMKLQHLDAVTLLDQNSAFLQFESADTSPAMRRFTTPAVTQSRKSLIRRLAYKMYVGKARSGRGLAILLAKSGLLKGFHWVNAAVANPITGVVFRTSWWLHLWSEFQRRVDDNFQVRKAHKALLSSTLTNSPLAANDRLAVKTSYRTSVSAKYKGLDFEIVNRVLSDYWLTGEIEIDESGDWSIDHIEEILDSNPVSRPSANQYREWCAEFFKIHN